MQKEELFEFLSKVTRLKRGLKVSLRSSFNFETTSIQFEALINFNFHATRTGA